MNPEHSPDADRDPPSMGAPPDFQALVEQTRGVQPLRRIFHAANGTAVFVAVTWLDLGRERALLILGALLILMLLIDVVRLTRPRVNAFFFRAFPSLVSPREALGVASSTWYNLGVILTLALFGLPAALTGILVLAWADPTASWIGRRWGRRPFLGGSVEGTLVFVGVAFAIVAVRHSLLAAAVTAPVLGVVERRSWPLDDNLAVPLAGAALVTLVETIA